MKSASFIFVTLGLCLATVLSAASSGQDDFAALERQFRELPIEARRLTGPLFWLHGDESKERLETYVGKVAEGGNGCFTVESRPHSDWLGPGWYRDLGICLEAAKRHNLQMWIFDEKWWPSQGIGGRVPARYAAKRLEGAATDVEGPRAYEGDGFAGERYVAAVGGRVSANGKIEGDSLVDLGPWVRDGRLAWQVPAGKWRIMKFTHVQASPLGQGQQLSVDGASKDCVNWYIQTVYQPHFDHFGADFGKTIRGFFYDEPETRGDWGTELNGTLAQWKVDWKKAYVAYKFELAGEEQIAAKYQYLEAFADTWGRTMYGGITRWCHEHGVRSIGHFMEHGGLYHNREYCAGDMMRLQRHSDMGAIDAVFKQFAMGQRDTDRDAPVWQTPKLASSISHVCGKPDDVTMVEIFGARGQDLTYREMKWWTDHMQVSGVNFMIPHSFNPRSPYDDDCPPYFYNGGFEPRWPLYRVWADYTSRLSLMLTGGRHVCPVAVLFSGNLGQVGKMVTPEAMTTALQDAQLDCDWLPMDVFERDAVIKPRPAAAPGGGGWAEIQLHGERYQALIVPPVEAIPYGTLAKVEDFFDNGGAVYGYEFLPSKSATIGKTSSDIARLCHRIWGRKARPTIDAFQGNPKEGEAWLLPQKLKPGEISWGSPFRVPRPIMLNVESGEAVEWFHLLHRRKNDRDILFIANQDHRSPARQFKFNVTAHGRPECWDPMRNEITTPISSQLDAETVDVSMTLEPLETVLLVFRREKIARPMRIEPDTKPIRDPIALVRDPNPPVEAPTPDMKRRPLTLSPVKTADPFRSRATIPADVDLAKCRVYLQMDDLPDDSAAVTVNDVKAGGVIGRPTRLEITRHLRPGENTIVIEPRAPKAAKVVFYGMD
jgi:hypothetical protein